MSSSSRINSAQLRSLRESQGNANATSSSTAAAISMTSPASTTLRRNSSAVWHFFAQPLRSGINGDEGGACMCRRCRAHIKQSRGSTYSLRRHLAARHRDAWLELLRLEGRGGEQAFLEHRMKISGTHRNPRSHRPTKSSSNVAIRSEVKSEEAANLSDSLFSVDSVNELAAQHDRLQMADHDDYIDQLDEPDNMLLAREDEQFVDDCNPIAAAHSSNMNESNDVRLVSLQLESPAGNYATAGKRIGIDDAPNLSTIVADYLCRIENKEHKHLVKNEIERELDLGFANTVDEELQRLSGTIKSDVKRRILNLLTAAIAKQGH